METAIVKCSVCDKELCTIQKEQITQADIDLYTAMCKCDTCPDVDIQQEDAPVVIDQPHEQ